jgi:hypothetical protein
MITSFRDTLDDDGQRPATLASTSAGQFLVATNLKQSAIELEEDVRSCDLLRSRLG